MKKLLAALLCLLLVVSAFVGCNEETGTSDLANAKAYLTNMYQTAGKGETMNMLSNKDMVAVVTIDGVSYTVEWSVNVTKGAADAIKVIESEKANHVTIDVGLPDYDVLFTATATVKDDAGNQESVSFNYKVVGLYGSGETTTTAPNGDGNTTTTAPNGDGNTTTTAPNGDGNTTTTTAPNGDGNTTTTTAPQGGTTMTQVEIVDAAYALEKDTALEGEYTLTGKVIGIGEAYDTDFQNITVTIQVAGREDKPIVCYRMKGDGIDKIVKNDTITVTGKLKNYNNTVEFDSGCTLRSRTPGEGVTQETEAGKIVDAAYNLQPGEDLGYDVTLTGKVTALDAAYNPDFKNVSVVITIDGRADKPILCYRMVGDNVDKVLVGDTITVTGTIKNYNGTIEFDAGCTMRKRVSGGAVVLTDPVEIVNAAYALAPGATLPSAVTLTGTIITIDDAYSSQYNNITVTIQVNGCDPEKPIKCYRMKGTGADSLKVGDVITVTGIIKNYQHSSGDCEVEFDSGCTFVK